MARRPSWLIVTAMAIALVASNLLWLYAILDQASIDKYREQKLHERLEALKDGLAAMPVLARDLGKGEVVSRVASALGDAEPFEKEGQTVVGWLTFRFDAMGHLEAVGATFPIDE